MPEVTVELDALQESLLGTLAERQGVSEEEAAREILAAALQRMAEAALEGALDDPLPPA